MQRDECPTCGGQGKTLISESNDQYDHTWLDWQICRTCDGEGSVEIEEEDDE